MVVGKRCLGVDDGLEAINSQGLHLPEKSNRVLDAHGAERLTAPSQKELTINFCMDRVLPQGLMH